MTEDDSGTVYRAPDADALLSDAFAVDALLPRRAAGEGQGRLGRDRVPPGQGPRRASSTSKARSGSTGRTSELRELEFLYTNLPGGLTRT